MTSGFFRETKTPAKLPARLKEPDSMTESAASAAACHFSGSFSGLFSGLAAYSSTLDLRACAPPCVIRPSSVSGIGRSEEHTSELQSLMRISYAVFCLKKKKDNEKAKLKIQ